MTFRKYSENKRVLLKNHLTEYLAGKKGEALPPIFKEQGLIDALGDFALRGKLIRGTLFLLASEMLGVKFVKELLDIACGIELMHSSLLIQDDIIDNDYMRRGAKTIFAKYAEDGKSIGAFNPYHYGISTAIVVADVAFFLAVDLLANYDHPPLSKLLKYYSHEIYLVSLAQSADSIFGQTNKEPDKEEIYAVYRHKTARYTFSLPFEMAAIVAQVDTKTRNLLDELGEIAGIIFQLKDDEIGLFGEEKTIGKPVGSDIRENKKTIIRFLLYQKANNEDLRILDSCFGNPDIKKIQIETVKKLYEKYKIQEYIGREIEELMGKIWILFEKIEAEKRYKDILKSLLEFNLQRSA